MSQLPISCYIRAHNEEKRIGAVIKAARDLVLEVIVIDCGSTDVTREVAAQAGARVLQLNWQGHGHQKRLGEEAATYDWLLDLDADEIISPALEAEIRQRFTPAAPDPGIFSLQLVTVPPFPKGVVWTGCNLARRNKLYHRDLIRMPAHFAWDQLDVPREIKVERLSSPLHHYSFFDIAHQVTKMNQVSSTRAHDTKLKSKPVLALRILFGFPIYLFKKLVLHRMYRAGIYGFACAAVIAGNRWLKDVKMYEIHLAKEGRNQILDSAPARSRHVRDDCDGLKTEPKNAKPAVATVER